MVPRASRVLVVESGDTSEIDDSSVADALASQGYEVRSTRDVVNGSATTERYAPDVLVIDLRGADPIATIRDIVRFVAPGGVADEYAHVPVRARRLLLEIATTTAVLAHRDLTVEIPTFSARRAGRELTLTPIELYLLVALLLEQGSVVAKSRLLLDLWGPLATNVNVVEVHISSLRRKLEEAGPRAIQTVRGIGYRLIA